MSNHQTRARRRVSKQRPPVSPLAVAGALLLIAVAEVLLAPVLMGRGEGMTLETHNVKGLATAPVVVEEWSDFQ